jgi:MFS family permease
VIGVVSLSISARPHTRPKLLTGLALIIAGLAWLGRAPLDSSYAVDVLPALVLLGLGFGLAMPALTTIGMASATDADSGLRSGLFNTSQQVGGALGLSVLAALAAAYADGARNLDAYHLAFLVAAAFVAAALVTAAVTLRRAPTATPSRRTVSP